MAGLVPAIYDFVRCRAQDVDARDKRGHDGPREINCQHKRGPDVVKRPDYCARMAWCVESRYMRPTKTNTITMIRMRPSPPPG
jgi:hypothetical protein